MYIIYGKGQFLELYFEKFKFEEIIAIADKNAKVGEKFRGIDVIHPSEIKNFDFNTIVVMTRKFYDEIKENLTKDYFIDKNKIFSSDFILYNEKSYSEKKRKLILDVVNNFKIKSVVEMQKSCIPKYTLYKNNFFYNEPISLDFIGKLEEKLENDLTKNVYDNIFEGIENTNKVFDLVILSDYDKSQEETVFKMSNNFKYCLVEFKFDFSRQAEIELGIEALIEKFASENIKVNGIIKFEKSVFYLLKKVEKINFDVNIFVVTHKEYNVMQDEVYKPICVGNKYTNEDYYNDHVGENIAHLNDKINECTAIYWMWKNTNSKYVGLNHYRRYFYSNDFLVEENILDKQVISDLMRKYDMLVAKSEVFNTTVLAQLLETTVNENDVLFVKEVFKKNINKFQPEYLSCFEAVMNESNNFFRCNLFITSRELFNEYCEWLFSFLIPIAEEVDTSKFEGSDKRLIGFFAERMLTVWLLKNGLKLFELPYSNINN